jgi:hypothetical protein
MLHCLLSIQNEQLLMCLDENNEKLILLGGTFCLHSSLTEICKGWHYSDFHHTFRNNH